MTREELNNLPEKEAFEELIKCCGSTRWATNVNQSRPFEDATALRKVADTIWRACGEQDYLEAFTHHPKIGDVKSLEKKFASTAQWASGEQKSVENASTTTIEKLAALNEAYFSNFGFIFIVCATGKSAEEMLELMEARMHNSYADELKIAAAEQHKITIIRLNKLLS
jgi:2-oxo-4-hydroxy-4-carboxy-5-ureidoimidazoline decarboxylase